MREIKEMADQVRQIACEIHAYHGHDLEKVYEKALTHRLAKAGV